MKLDIIEPYFIEYRALEETIHDYTPIHKSMEIAYDLVPL